MDRQTEHRLIGAVFPVAAGVGKHLIHNGGLVNNRAHGKAHHLTGQLPQQQAVGISGDPLLHGPEGSGLFRREASGFDLSAALRVLGLGAADHQRHLRLDELLEKYVALADPGSHIAHVQQIGLLDLLRVGGAAVGEHHHMVIQGDGVIAGGADTVGGSGAGEEDRVYSQTAQQQVQSCVEKGGVAGLDDLIIPLLTVEFRGIFPRNRAGAAGSQGLAALGPHGVAGVFHITAVSAVGPIDEHHRDTSLPAAGDKAGTGGHRGTGTTDAQGRFRVQKPVLHINDQKGVFHSKDS